MKKLQIALDTTTIQEGFEIIDKVYDYIDIIEIGTPMIFRYGVNAIKEFKDKYSEKIILADMKIADAGYFETKLALEKGADIVTVLGVADNDTIKDSLKATKEYNKELLVDLIETTDKRNKVETLENMGVDYICVHTGVDKQKRGYNPLDELKEIESFVNNTKIASAGGINLDTAFDIAMYSDVVIVGGFLTNAKDSKMAAKELKEKINCTK